MNIVPFTRLFYGVHYFFYYQHGWYVEGVTIIKSFLGTRQGDPLRGHLFILAHHQALLKTIMQAPNCIFPSLVNDTHIMGPMNEITHAYEHLSTQLTLVGLKVKVSKCKLWHPSWIFHRDSSRLHFGHKWLTHFRWAGEFSELCHSFFGSSFILRHDAYQWSSSLRKRPSWFGHFVFMCNSSTFLSHTDNTFFFFLHVFFGKLWQENYAGMWRHYRSMIMGVFSGPLKKVSNLTADILWWYKPSPYGGLCPIYFSRELNFSDSIFVV